MFALKRRTAGEGIDPDKEKSVEKIDGIAPSLMALDRSIRSGTTSGTVSMINGALLHFDFCQPAAAT